MGSQTRGCFFQWILRVLATFCYHSSHLACGAVSDSGEVSFAPGVQGVRCLELEGVYPLGAQGEVWSDELAQAATELCASEPNCNGIMRYIGDDPVHCKDWCGRPQFCAATGPLEANSKWVTYVKMVQKTQVSPSLRELKCPPRRGSSGEHVFLWSGMAPAVRDASVPEDACTILHIPFGKEQHPVPLWLDGVLSEFLDFSSVQKPEVGPWEFYFDSHDFATTSLGAPHPKRHLLSVLLLNSASTCLGPGAAPMDAADLAEMWPGHVYIDTGSRRMRELAFAPYRFVLICGNFEELSFPPEILVDALAYATHPLVPQDLHLKLSRVFFHLPDAAQAFKSVHIPNLQVYFQDMLENPEKENMVQFKQTFMLLTQQLFWYRYSKPAERRLADTACGLCRDRGREKRVGTSKEAAAVTTLFCTMSRRAAASLRQTVRQTWGQAVAARRTAAHRFFVGGGSEPLEDVGDDVVALGVPDSYRFLNVKAFAMLDWAHTNFPELRWLVRHDDDIYLRPGALLSLLDQRPPISYLWGNFDHGSNPVRDPSHPHYNSYEQFPEQKHPMWGDIFPPYARGHLWAMSGDLLAHVVGAWRNEKAHSQALSDAEMSQKLPHPDDPAIGVVLANLLREDQITINIDDRDFNSFSLNPSCTSTFSNIHGRTWVVHHVKEDTMRCMFELDTAAAEPENVPLNHTYPDLCACSTEVEEEVDPMHDGAPFWYPRTRFGV